MVWLSGLGDRAPRSVRVVLRAPVPFYPSTLLCIHDLVGDRPGLLDDLLCEQAQADRAVLARVESDGDTRVETVGDQVLWRRAVTVQSSKVSPVERSHDVSVQTRPQQLCHYIRRAAIVSTRIRVQRKPMHDVSVCQRPPQQD